MGIGVLLVEQNAKQSLAIANRGYLLENTRITHSDSAARLMSDPAVQAAYFGAGAKALKPAWASSEPAEPTEARPAAVPVTVRPIPRRSAEQQIGVSIEKIVRDAARVSSSAKQKPAPDLIAAGNQLASDRLSVVLKDIESAAKAARNLKTNRRNSRMRKYPQEHGTPNADSSPPVIEVYRRPRVEVYRRRPSGQFETD